MSFPRYARYKGSGIEWLGEVPEHWEVKRLRFVFRIVTDRPTDDSQHVVALENIESWTGRFIETETKFEGEGVRFHAGDLLFGKLRPYLAKILIAASSGDAIGDFHVLRPHANGYSEFLQFLFLTPTFIELMNGSTIGAKMPRVGWPFMADLKIPVPPLGEQKRLAKFLDQETAKIDALIEEQRRLVALLKEKRQEVISHAVTKGLNPAAQMKDSGVFWLGNIPSHWEVKALSDLARPGTVVTYGIVQAGPDIEGGIPYIRTSDMSEEELGPDGYLRTSEEIDRSYRRSKVNAGDLVIAIRATVGKALLVPNFLDGANLTQGTAKFSPDDNNDVHFVRHFLNNGATTEFDLYSKGATFKEITLDRLRRVRVCRPPLDEQRSIVAWLEIELQIMDELIGAAKTSVGLLQERRSALISAAVTGKIDVRNYSPRETPSHEEVYESA